MEMIVASTTLDDSEILNGKETSFLPIQTSEPLIRIPGIANPFEASMLEESLRSAQIPFAMEPHHETAHSGIFVPSRSWGSVVVPERHAEETLLLLQEIRETFTENENTEPDSSE